MSLEHRGLWHYEHIPGRKGGRGEWRVADEDDDVITDFASEDEAAAFVRQHNAGVSTAPRTNWRY